MGQVEVALSTTLFVTYVGYESETGKGCPIASFHNNFFFDRVTCINFKLFVGIWFSETLDSRCSGYL